jgi:hypothetical protein
MGGGVWDGLKVHIIGQNSNLGMPNQREIRGSGKAAGEILEGEAVDASG